MKQYKTVDEFLSDLDKDKLQQVNELRSIIKKAGPELKEVIKWNSPSFMLDNEYRVTFNLLNKERVVKIVLHLGTPKEEARSGKPVLHDESGLIEWRSDIRGIITFNNIEEVRSRASQLEKIIRDWLKIEA